MFAFTDRRGRVEVAFTDRDHGRLDLADRPGEPSYDGAVARVRAALDPVDPPVWCRMDQVHGREVATVSTGRTPRADGLVTDRPGHVLVALAADCVPVLLADPGAGVIAAVHAGRPGVLAGVVEVAVDRLHDHGAREVIAWIGPHVCGRCYEVPADLQEQVAEVVPAALATTSWGTPSLALGAGVRAQLVGRGVAEVVDVGRCTREDPDLFSYRRDGAAAGRHAGLIWLRR